MSLKIIKQILRAVLRLYAGLASRCRNLFYTLLGVQFNGYVWLRAVEIPRNWHQVKFLGSCSLDKGVTLLASGTEASATVIEIGTGTYINRHTIIDASKSIRVGADCMIGPGCFITDSDHGTNLDQLIRLQEMVSSPVVIEDGVWIGAHVTILKGVRVGAGAIVGAGAVVTGSIPAGAIAVGVPAKVIGQRGSQVRSDTILNGDDTFKSLANE